MQRAYWEKAGNEYTWHGGEEQPPEGYVKLNEPPRGNPNNKKKLYDVYGPAPIGKKKAKKKGGAEGGTPPPVAAKGGAKKPLSKGEATNQAKGAPALMESAETHALAAAAEMQKAGTPDLAVAAAKAAEVAAAAAKASAGRLSDLVKAVAGFADIAEEVRKHEAAAVSASDAAARFAAQAARLAEVVETRVKASLLAQSVEDEKVKLDAARKLATELTSEVDYLRSYHGALSRDLAAVGGGSFTPTVDPATLPAQILLDITAVEQAQQETADEIEELVASVAALDKEHGLATDAVPVKELSATTGSAGLAESQADIEARRTLRTLAGGEVNLSTLLALPKFAGSLAVLKPYLDALKPSGLKPAAAVSLLTGLSATRSDAELAIMATAIAAGAGLQVTVALAGVEPKVSAADVALYAAVQQAAACPAQVVLDLLPARSVALYATQPVLTQLAILAKDGASATRIAEIIMAEPALPTAELAELTKVFAHYPAKDDMLLVAKMAREGMKGGRKASDVTDLLTELASEGAAVPAAAIVKIVLQSAELPDFTISQVAGFLIALPGLSGDQLVEVSRWLKPLSVADKLNLITDVFVADGTPAAAIHATFRSMSAAALDGDGIYNRVNYLRGFVTAPGGAANASITNVGGKKDFTGPEIHAHALSVLTGPRPQDKVGNLEKYPKGENPHARSIDTLWLDANPAPRNTETQPEAERRQKLAVAELCDKPDVIPTVVQQILKHQYGAAPRPIGLPSAEDALDPGGEAHTNRMHTIGGGGNINTPYQQAARACYSPTSAGKASAFKSPAAAQAGMQAALDNYVAANPNNWPWLRGQLTKGYATAIDRPVGANRLVSLETNGGGGPNGLYDRDGAGSFVNQQAKPKYDGGRGGRKYFPGDTGVIWSRTGFVIRENKINAAFETWGGGPDNKIPVEPTTLTTFAPITGVHLRVIGMNVNGGFVINSAYAYQ